MSLQLSGEIKLQEIFKELSISFSRSRLHIMRCTVSGNRVCDEGEFEIAWVSQT